MVLSLFDNTAYALVIFGFSISLVVLVLIRPIAIHLGLVDSPSSRKMHEGRIPLVGGFGVFLSVVIYFLLVPSEASHEIIALISTGSIIFLLGVLDDFKGLSPRIKLFVEFSICLFMILITDIKIDYLSGFWPGYEIYLGQLAIPVTMLFVVFVMNSFNLVDGIDGLAGMLGVVAIVGILLLQSMVGAIRDFEYLVILLFSLIPFIYFNVFGGRRSKIFLGDSGSLFLGYIISWTLVYQVQHVESNISVPSVLWLVALPVIDTLGVMFRRILKKQSPLKADRDHLHHILLRAGLSSYGSLMILTFFSSFIVMIGLLIEVLFPLYSFICFIILFFAYYYVLKRAWKLQQLLKKSAD